MDPYVNFLRAFKRLMFRLAFLADPSLDFVQLSLCLDTPLTISRSSLTPREFLTLLTKESPLSKNSFNLELRCLL